MLPMLSSSSPTALRPGSRRGAHIRPLSRLSTSARRSDGIAIGHPLADYLDTEGRVRELFALPGHAGSVLVLDRDAATLCDRRLVAHLAADEPSENAEIVCRHYLDDIRGRWCRRVQREDLEIAPSVERVTETQVVDTDGPEACVVDSDGNAYRLRVSPGERSTAQLRWCRRSAGADDSEWEQVGLRDVVAALESYEPMRTLTERAIADQRHYPGVLLTRLCSELERLCTSPIVLNRALRVAVLEAIERRGTSMSEIALRCGIVKHDRRGKPSGETSWLARRVGIMPEGGEKQITPWVHSDVLAVIARKGLGISPREVELQ
jgi:AraC-like DNA-binding protein